MPDSERRRQKRALWTGVFRASGLGTALLLLGVFLSQERIRRHGAEQAAARAKEDIDVFFHLSTDLFAIATKDGYFSALNDKWPELLGYTRNELMTQPYTAFVHPDDRTQTSQAAALLKKGLHVIDFTNRYVHKDQRRVFTLVWRANVDPHGRILATARPVLTNLLVVH